MSDDRDEGRDADRDDEQEGDSGTEQSEEVPLSDLRRDIERRRGRTPERADEDSARGSGKGRGATSGGGSQESGAGEDQGEARAGEAAGEPAAEPAEEPSAKGPLSNLREGVERRRRERRETPSEAEDAFETASTEPVIDGEQVWEDLLASHDESSAGLAFGEVVEGEPEDVRIIPDRVCHNCTYFGDPPEVHCEHEGTEIRRVVDQNHFEVVECPVVKNRSDLTGQ